MKYYTTAIFDLDGTLLDTLADLTSAVNHTMECFGYPTHSEDDVRRFVGNGLRKLTERAIPDGTANPNYEAAFTELKTYYTAHCKEKTAPYKGILDLLQRLSNEGIAMAIVSNKNDAAVKRLAADFFSDTISVAIGETPQVQKKPAPDTVFAALEELHRSAEESIYIGDSDVDIQTAKNSGMDCVSVSWGFRGRTFLEKEGASHIVDTPEEILTFFI